MTVSEKAAYIKGLMEGMDIDTSKGEGKILAAMADLLEDLSLSVMDLEDETATLNDYIEEIDEDLGALEEEVYDCDCDCDDCDCDDCDDCDCDDCDCCDCCDESFEITCPSCGETIVFDGEIDPEDLSCPACGEKLVCECEDED